MEFTSLLTQLTSYFSPAPLIPKESIPFTVMILSPHPDDECISGALALRLQKENHAHVVNVAVTLGSNKERMPERMKELEAACELLDFELIVLDENWKNKAKELKSLIQKYQPDLIIAPHLHDHHPTHIRTGELLKTVLASLKKTTTLVAWSEFWGPLRKPNLLVEVPTEILEMQMQGLLCHQGEITRNPYHLRLPAWMMDSVRRGSEVIGGAGTQSSQMSFGVIYQLQKFSLGKFSSPKLSEKFLNCDRNLAQIFKLILEPASGSRTKVK